MGKRALSTFLLSIFATSALAGVRHFTFLYEAPTSAPGSVEMENWITWKRGSSPRFDQVDFRHEFEFGITDRFQLSVYLADWNYQSNPSGFVLSDAAVEAIYNFSNPVIDPVGLSIYQELRAGDRLVEWESKVIAQKNYGRWIFAYNATLEAVWAGNDLDEREGEFSQALGASYEISPRLSVGLEFLHEFVFPDWRDHEEIRNVFVGPNVSYRRANWFVTTGILAQATDTPDEADFQWRTIVGIGF